MLLSSLLARSVESPYFPRQTGHQVDTTELSMWVSPKLQAVRQATCSLVLSSDYDDPPEVDPAETEDRFTFLPPES